MSADLLAGVYRHYKGPLYLVLGLAHDANADSLYDDLAMVEASEHSTTGGDPLGEREVVVYVPLQLDGAHTGPRLAVRTREDFDAEVCIDPECDRYGSTPRLYHDLEYAEADRSGRTLTACRFATRFTYLGPTWEGPA